MPRLVLVTVCLLLFFASRAQAACEPEYEELLRDHRLRPTGPTIAFLDNDILHEAGNGWRDVYGLGPRPADPRAALRRYGAFHAQMYLGQGHNYYRYSRFIGCRAPYLADQMDAADKARLQQGRDAAARAARDRQLREQQVRDARAAQERQDRERGLRDQLDRERAQRQALEAELKRQRDEEARKAAEEDDRRAAAEEAEYQRQQRSYLEQVRKQREEAKRREEDEKRQAEERKPFQARNVTECLRLMTDDESGTYGGFINSCDFNIYFSYCAYGPKANEFETKFECSSQGGGFDHIAANGRQAAFTRQAERIYWFACNAPSMPKVTFQPGTGLYGTCK